jgi:hypothetical protein
MRRGHSGNRCEQRQTFQPTAKSALLQIYFSVAHDPTQLNRHVRPSKGRPHQAFIPEAYRDAAVLVK